MTLYIWGIDVAENLNFFAIWILYVEAGHIRVKTVKKFRKVLYPTLHDILTDKKTGYAAKYPPREIWVDYTNEKSFSEWLEAKFHPAFSNPSSKQYKKWQIVHPVISTQPTNLQMKQNAAHLMQPNNEGVSVFEWPHPKKTRPETGVLIEEAKQQMLRESAQSMGSAGMTKPVFPKPIGYDNDLIRALELGLMGARKFVTVMSNLSGKVVAHGSRLEPPRDLTKDIFIRDMLKRTAGLGARHMDVQWST